MYEVSNISVTEIIYTYIITNFHFIQIAIFFILGRVISYSLFCGSCKHWNEICLIFSLMCEIRSACGKHTKIMRVLFRYFVLFVQIAFLFCALPRY